MDSDLLAFNSEVLPNGHLAGVAACAFDPAGVCSGVWAGDVITLEEELQMVSFPFEWRRRDKSHLAAFANVSYALDEELEIAFGLRVDRWKNKSNNLDTGISSSQKSTEVLPRASLTRRIDNGIVYATVARGYEPGGFNLASFSGVDDLLPFKAEKATSIEVGWKGGSGDGRVVATVAGFFIDYDDRQVEYQAVDSVTGEVLEGITNIGDSRQLGLEADLTVQVSETLRLSASAGWVDAEWRSGTVVEGAAPGGRDVFLSGKKPPVVADFNWNLNADYRQPLQATLNFWPACR